MQGMLFSVHHFPPDEKIDMPSMSKKSSIVLLFRKSLDGKLYVTEVGLYQCKDIIIDDDGYRLDRHAPLLIFDNTDGKGFASADLDFNELQCT